MAANVRIMSFHDATGTTQSYVDSTTVRFKQADNDTQDLNNLMTVTAATTVRSWVKHFKFAIDTTPPSNAVNNLRIYSDGSSGMGTGVDIKVKTSATYLDPISNATTALSGSPSSLFSYTVGAPLAVSGSATSGTTTPFGDYIQMQMEVVDTAGPGTTPSESVTFAFDES